MLWLYRLLFLPALLCSLPYFVWRMLRRGGYRHDFHHRFGLMDRPPPKPEGVKRLWIQAVSVGEAQAVGPLLKELAGRGHEVVLTTTTSTGYALIRQHYARDVLKTGIFPMDFWPCSRSAWRRIEPDLAVLMEGELWPEHLAQARARGAPVALINARLSDRSFRRYRRAGGVARWLLGQVHVILCATTPDHERFLALGADPVRTHRSGSLKLDTPAPPPLAPPVRAALRADLGFAPAPGGPEPLVLLGASTWDGEETLLLETVAEARATGLDARLLLIPRHAERRREVMASLQQQPLPWHARSAAERAPGAVVVYLGDTTGELAHLAQAADLAFIGKSLPPHEGGQTPVECAALGVPLVYGPRMSNFRELCRQLESAGAAVRVEDAAAARAALLALLPAAARRAQMGAAARAWHAANQGATARTAAALEELLRA